MSCDRSPDDHGVGTSNLLLRALNRHDIDLLAPNLVPMRYANGDLLGMGDAAHPLVYFPETLVACLHAPDDVPGTGPGTGLIGHEGLGGWSALFDRDAGHHQARAILKGGTARVVAAADLREAAKVSPTLALSLLRYVQILVVQMSCTIAVNIQADLQLRISRWLLMLHDRVGGDEFAITHEALAEQLGLRRASITDTLHLLEGYRALRCTRGRIVVRDRALLETRAGSAYGAPERAYRRAIGAFGKSACALENLA